MYYILDTYYTVQEGDTLYSIAEEYYKDGRLWRIIYLDNKDLIGNDPHDLEVGIQLRIL